MVYTWRKRYRAEARGNEVRLGIGRKREDSQLLAAVDKSLLVGRDTLLLLDLLLDILDLQR